MCQSICSAFASSIEAIIFLERIEMPRIKNEKTAIFGIFERFPAKMCGADKIADSNINAINIPADSLSNELMPVK